MIKLAINKPTLALIAFFQSLVATFGSLFFSEVMGWTPCKLCWLQRIFMYPLVLIIGIAIYTEDKNFYKYVLPMSVIGWIIAFYHNLLYYGIIPEGPATCDATISCTLRQGHWFGFLSIPLLSLIAFTVINLCMLFYRKAKS